MTAAPGPQPQITIDLYSVATVPIEMFFEGTRLSIGTAFVWAGGGAFFLITNWHNVSGRDPFTGKHLSSTAAEPNRIVGWFNVKDRLGQKRAVPVPLRDGEGKPLWWVHPKHRQEIDAVALPLAQMEGLDMHPINAMPTMPLQLGIGAEVFVLG
jgi:hypothetical protein